jgi:hypothetical protein
LAHHAAARRPVEGRHCEWRVLAGFWPEKAGKGQRHLLLLSARPGTVFEEGDFTSPRVASRRRREQPRSWQVSMGGKIVDAQLAEKVKALRNEGKTQDQIAVELRIVQSTVSAILRRDGLGGHLTSARRRERRDMVRRD